MTVMTNHAELKVGDEVLVHVTRKGKIDVLVVQPMLVKEVTPVNGMPQFDFTRLGYTS